MIDDLRHFRANDEHMRRLLVALCATAAVMLTITAHTMAFQDAVGMEQDRAEAAQDEAQANANAAKLAAHLSTLVVACMNGRAFAWTDPLDGMDKMAVCDVQVIGKVR